MDGKAEILLDPNTLSKDGTVSLSTYSISEDGKYIAYGLSKSGSDWVTIHAMSITDKQPMPDKLLWVSSGNLRRMNSPFLCVLYNKLLVDAGEVLIY